MKFGKFGESFAIHQTKVVVTINNPLVDLFIHQTFSAKYLNSPNILPTKFSRYTLISYNYLKSKSSYCKTIVMSMQ